MNVHFTYKLSKTPDVEQIINSQIDKLNRRLQVFKPDMVSLRGYIDEGHRNGFSVSLNLRLPAGQMAAKAHAGSLQAALRSGFEDLLEQLDKHKQHLRSEYKWPRVRRVGRTRPQPQVPFEDTIAAVKPDKVSSEDVTSFIDANLDRLQRYVERELAFRRNNGQRFLSEVRPEEVIDEAIASALDDTRERPEKVALEAWLYRLSRSAMDRLANQLNADPGSVPLQSSGTNPNIHSADEDRMQFHHPDERVSNENLIADQTVATPEEIASNDELMSLVERALHGCTSQQRDAFVLFTIEGFRIAEIATITDRSPEQVRADISAAREVVRKALPVPDRLRDKLIEHSVVPQPRSA